MATLPGSDPAAIRAAAELIASGELVAFPTETVYGLGARADRDGAVRKIFDLKKRPADHPLIVHVLDEASAEFFAQPMPPAARNLVRHTWPGPVTLILRRRPGVADAAAAGQSTIGLRSPAHPVARALLIQAASLGVPGIAAPSANRFGRISPTAASDVRDELGDDLAVLDGGPCPVGIESAIVDCSGERLQLLRPGTIDRGRLEEAAGEPLATVGEGAPRAPGTLESHYAPRARVRLMESDALRRAWEQNAIPPSVAVYARMPFAIEADPARWRPMPSDPDAAARELFAVLRSLDRAGAAEIWVERPPADARWEGVADRLRRAAR
ncbi:MAG: threonylcarbamoyl-AMP synthase [Planctomycetes bacterium]|nr:threonylcarbamoyl-AMP synthase [Planctomycetota bacterium]